MSEKIKVRIRLSPPGSTALSSQPHPLRIPEKSEHGRATASGITRNPWILAVAGATLVLAGIIAVQTLKDQGAPPEVTAGSAPLPPVAALKQPKAPETVEQTAADTSSPQTTADTSSFEVPETVAQPAADTSSSEVSETEGNESQVATVGELADAPSPESDAFTEALATHYPASGFSSASVSRAQFTNAIRRREPIDSAGPVIAATDDSARRLYYFTELKGMSGETVTHSWEYEGKLVATIPFKVGANRWRAYSSKYLEPSKRGRWQVLTADSNGKPIHTDTFIYK
jgi:Protein of unknown function (DUF2914).